MRWFNGCKAKKNNSNIQYSGDITEIKNYAIEMERRFKEAEAANKAKNAFLANMSHEIRTPMNAILGITEIELRKEDILPETEEVLVKIYESGNLLLNIINDIFDLSKIEAGKLEIVPVNYDLPSLVNDSIQINLLRYENKPVEFKLKIDENTPVDLFGDEFRIKQILNNILSNAFKYTDKGEVELSVTAQQLKKQAEFQDNEKTETMIVFRVSDTGPGITEEQIHILLEKDTHFNIKANSSTISTGLGISLSKLLLKMMNGDISVESKLGKGTVFTMRIPQVRTSQKVCGAELAEKLKNFRYQTTSINKRNKVHREYMPYGNVLIVDDVESNIYVAKGMMMSYGLQIDTAHSGFEAIGKVKNGNVYDIIFMDYMMPRMDGIETVKKIRDIGYKHTIIALTANAVAGQAESFLENGFDGFISKPIDSRELNQYLINFIRNKKPREVVEAARRELRNGKNETAISSEKEVLSELEKFFVRDAEKILSILSEIYEKMQDGYELDDTDIECYIIAVHGMKNVLANMGETKLSETALLMEQAGRDRDINVMSNETHSFLDSLNLLINKYKPVSLTAADSNKKGGRSLSDKEISDDDKIYLQDKLNEIRSACGKLDKKSAKAALYELKGRKWPYQINEMLDEITVHLLHSAFKKIIAIIENDPAGYFTNPALT